MEFVNFGLHTATGTSSVGNAGGTGPDSVRAAHYPWDKLEGQRETMDLVTFGLHTTAGASSGGNGRQWIW